jgi:hypothetical protein
MTAQWAQHAESKYHHAVRMSSRARRSCEKYIMKEKRKQCLKKQQLRAMLCACLIDLC